MADLKENIAKTTVFSRKNFLFLLLLVGGLMFVQNALAREITFSWAANGDNPPVDGYRLYYKTGDPGQTLNDYDGVNVSGGNSSPVDIAGQNITSYTLQNLSDDQKYSFVMTAYRGSQESAPTAAVTAPVVSSNTRSVSFAWTANSENPPVDGYRIYYKTGDPGQTLADYTGVDADGSNASPVEVVDQGTTNFLLANLENNQKYSFVLTAYRGIEESAPTSALVLDAISSGGGSGNTAPIASGEAISVDENSSFSGVLGATDADGDALLYSITSGGAKGTAVVTNASAGTFIYTPNTDASGTDSFSFKVNDGTVDSNVATVSVTINSVNEQPQTSNSTFATNEGTQYSGQLTASDPDGDQLQYSIVSNGSKGAAAITNASTGAFTYTPNTDASGTDSFTFKVNDGTVDSNIATVTATINATNDQPQAFGSSITVDEDQTYSGQLTASDADGDALQFSIVSNAAKGTASVTNQATGTFTYAPLANTSGNDAFTFKVNDGTVDSQTVTVTVNITPVNDAPVADNSSFNVEQDTEFTGQLSASDPDGDALIFTVVDGAGKGSVAITGPASGTFIYTPNTNESGSDTFTFKVNDGSADSALASVTLNINSGDTVTAVFGDVPTSDYPGTISDTFAGLNTDINADMETMNSYSWSSTKPNKVANTIVMKADLQALPANATIISAELQLYQTGFYGAANYDHSVHKISGKDAIISQVHGYNAFNGEPWTAVPAGTTHNDVPLGLADIGPAEDTITLDVQNGYRSWQVTEMVQEWVNDPTTNFGLLIKGQVISEETGRSFASSENQTADIRPMLTIQYTTMLPPPQLIMIEEVK